MNSALLFAAGGLTAFDGSLVSTSVVLVFALLVALCIIVMLEGKLFDLLSKKRENAVRAAAWTAKVRNQIYYIMVPAVWVDF